MIVVFAGPTISHSEVQQHIESVCLPPIRHGDLIQIIDQKPRAVGIIDGYFEGAPSVWHKEILYALDQGVHVYGSASMGALRAAELHTFGMHGVGQIFEWYRDLVIEEDDEVAVLHGPAEVEFAVASEPMVSIRATLALAAEQGVIDAALQTTLIDQLKGTFYKKRTWRLVKQYAGERLHGSALSRFESWIDRCRIDLKKEDAISMLTTMADAHRQTKTPYEAAFNFEWTNAWDTAYTALRAVTTNTAELSQNDSLVLDQLRLNPEEYERFRDRALLTWICDHRVDTAIKDESVQTELKQFRQRNTLHTRTQLLDYMSKVGVDEEELTAMLERSAQVAQVANQAGELHKEIVGQLKLTGHYLDYLNRAERKRDALRSAGLTPDRPGVLRPQLLSWYSKQSGRPIPEDLSETLDLLDLERVEDFYRLIAADYLYWQLTQ